MLKKIEWGLSDEKDAVDHSSPCNNDNPGLKKKQLYVDLRKMAHSTSSFRANYLEPELRDLLKKLDLVRLFCPTKRAN